MEGGKWIIFWSITFTNFLLLCVHGSYGRLLIELNTTFPDSNTLLLIVSALGRYVGLLFTIVVLLINHTLGFKTSFLLGVLITSIGLVLMTVHSGNVYRLIPTYGLLVGIFQRLVMTTNTFLIAKMFPYVHRFHFFTTSAQQVLLPFGVIIGGFWLNIMLRYITWEQCILVFCSVFFVFGIASYLLMIYNKEDYEESEKKNKLFAIEEKPRHTACTRRCVYVIVFGLFGISWFCKNIISQTPFIIMVQHAKRLGIDETKGTSLIATMGLVEGLSRLLASFLGDKIFKGRMLVIYICLMPLIAMGNIYGALCNVYWQLMIYNVLTGLLVGPIVAGLFSVNYEILNGLYVEELFSVSSIFRFFGIMVGLLLDGVILDLTGSYRWAFYLNTILAFIAFVALFIIWKFKQKFISYLS